MKQLVMGVILAGALSACVTVALPEGGLRSTALVGAEATKLLDQCSRPDPVFQSTYVLSGPEKAALDANLTRLALLKDADGRGVRELDSYVYQYAGIINQGVRQVYVHAVMPPPDDILWKTQAMILCDGGDRSFGTVYDPATKTFSNFAINGSYAKGR